METLSTRIDPLPRIHQALKLNYETRWKRKSLRIQETLHLTVIFGTLFWLASNRLWQ